MQTQVLGLSVDSQPCLTAWAESLGGINYPLLSDFYPHGYVTQMYGVFRSEGYSERAIFVIDKRRIIRYVDVHDIEEQPDNEVLFRVLAELEPNSAGARELAGTAHPPLLSPEPDADVVMYCTPWCPACSKARTYLKERGVNFAEVDISRDRNAAERVKRWANGYETTPTFNVRGTILVDFNKDRLARAIDSLED